MMQRGKISITSKAGETVPSVDKLLSRYLKSTGVHLYSPTNAPLLNFNRLVPFEVVPSGNMMIGLYCPVLSMSSCLSVIVYSACCRTSGDAPLGI